MKTIKNTWRILAILAFVAALGAFASSSAAVHPAEARVGDPIEVFLPCEEMLDAGVDAYDSMATATCSEWLNPASLPQTSLSEHDIACNRWSGYQIIEAFSAIRFWGHGWCDGEMAEMSAASTLLVWDQDEYTDIWSWVFVHGAVPPARCELCQDVHSEGSYPISSIAFSEPRLWKVLTFHYEVTPSGEVVRWGENPGRSETDTFVYPPVNP